MNKFYFPMETMRITQNPYGNTSHHEHNLGTPKDYPIDCGGADGNKSACICPVNMKVTAVKGLGNKGSNTIWLVSTEKVKTPTFEDIVFMTLTHWDDNDSAIKKHNKVGSIIKKGEIICYEGKDGASANHIHICVGRGYSDNWIENSKKKLVIVGDNKLPNEVMYRYTKLTTRVMDNGGLKWVDTDTNNYSGFLPEDRGYFKPGDSGDKVSKICDYFSKKVSGNYFGDYLESCVKTFQKQNNLEQDGCIGKITLAKMKEQGFQE